MAGASRHYIPGVIWHITYQASPLASTRQAGATNKSFSFASDCIYLKQLGWSDSKTPNGFTAEGAEHAQTNLYKVFSAPSVSRR